MPDTLTTYDAVMKDVFLPGIRNSLNNEVLIFKIANAAAEKAGGRRLIFPVKVDRNWGVGTRAENATLPTAGNEVFVTATITPTSWYSRIQLSGQLMAQSQGGDQNAFADAMTEIMAGPPATHKQTLHTTLF